MNLISIFQFNKRNCPHRRLEIRQDGQSTMSYCGKIISKNVIQAFNKLEVVYINDGGDISSCQYSMRYYSTRMVSCGAHVFHQNVTTFEWNGTVFTTPYYPYPGLPPKTDCDIRFIAQPKYRVAIQFLDVDIVPSENCRSDHINTFSIISGFRHSLIARICSQISSDERYFSDQAELYIQIKTFSNVRRRGVRFITKYVHENELSQYLSDSKICGQSFFNESSGTIKLTRLNRLNHLTCAWHIQAALGWKVQLRVVNLNLGKSKKCSNKYLVIYNSPPRSDLQPTDRLCGSYVQQSPHNIVVLSDGSHMFIRLFKLPKTSFTNDEFIHLEYSVVNTELKNDSCPGFHCHGGQICTDPEKLLCYSISRYCIPWELRCDHRSSCAKFDNSDEESCLFSNLKTHFTTILLTVSLILILGLFLAFAFCNLKPAFIRKSRQNNLSTDSMEITENQFSMRNIDPKFLIEKEERINTIHCNHQQMPDINYPSASSSFYLFYNNDVSRVTFTNHHTES